MPAGLVLAESAMPHVDSLCLRLECAWFSAQGTSHGQRIQSIDLDGQIRPVPIDAKALGERVDAFWDRFPFTLPLYYREVVGGANCCADMLSIVRSMPLYQGDLQEGAEFVDAILAEAVSLKQWTIPFGAYVLLHAGEIDAAKLYEIGNDVAVLLVNRQGEYLQVWVNPVGKCFVMAEGTRLATTLGAWAAAGLKNAGTDAVLSAVQNSIKASTERFELGLKILLASIIRDFWVVEERERLFGASMELRKSPRLQGDRGRPHIVYLPRIRFVGSRESCKDLASGLDLKARAPDFVVGHLRKAVHAAEQQIILARQYGIMVPQGFTFVRPHRRALGSSLKPDFTIQWRISARTRLTTRLCAALSQRWSKA